MILFAMFAITYKKLKYENIATLYITSLGG